MKNSKLPPNWPIPDAYLLELGRINCLWSSLESYLIMSISELAGYEEMLDWRVMVMMAHAGFAQRVDILSTLCDELQFDCPQLSNYKNVISKLKSIQARRNQYVHSGMRFDEEHGTVITSSMKARGKMKTKIEKVPLTELQKVSEDIHLALLDLQHLVFNKKDPPIWEKES